MRRNSTWVAAVVVAVAAGLLIGGTTAFGGSEPKPVTASEFYAPGMTLDEISAASAGKPGEVIPPCPEAAVIAQLKKEGLPSGPCDPLPEAGEELVLPGITPGPNSLTKEVCPGAFLNNLTPGGPTQVTTPCGPGAQMGVVEPAARTKDGRDCVKVTYRTAAERAEQTATVCMGDPRGPDKPHVTNKVG